MQAAAPPRSAIAGCFAKMGLGLCFIADHGHWPPLAFALSWRELALEYSPRAQAAFAASGQGRRFQLHDFCSGAGFTGGHNISRDVGRNGAISSSPPRRTGADAARRVKIVDLPQNLTEVADKCSPRASMLLSLLYFRMTFSMAAMITDRVL